MKQTLSIVVPCYNEEQNIKEFYLETEKYVFVDDGSKDQTLSILR